MPRVSELRNTDTPRITIVVPTRNRRALLARLLASLERLRYPSWTVAVVDDGSTDDTASEVARFARHGLPVTYLVQPWSGMGAARNLALAHVESDLVAFTDDDCSVQPDWLKALATAFQRHPEALGVQGKTVTNHAAMTPFTRQIEQLEGGPPYRTCNIAYRTGILRELGGFDPHLIRGEDVVMAMRVLERGPIVFEPGAVVEHPPRPKEWADRQAWRRLLESEMHFRFTYPKYAPYRSRTLSIQHPRHVLTRWLVWPVRRYWRRHYDYLRQHPAAYARHIPYMIREKLALFAVIPFMLRGWFGRSGGES